MDIQSKDAVIAEIEQFKEEALKMYIVEVLADSYTNTNLFDYAILENKNNKVWWMKTQAYQLWKFWKKAKSQTAPEGFVLLPKEPTQDLFRTFYNAFNACEGGNTAQHFKAGYRAMVKMEEQNK